MQACPPAHFQLLCLVSEKHFRPSINTSISVQSLFWLTSTNCSGFKSSIDTHSTDLKYVSEACLPIRLQYYFKRHLQLELTEVRQYVLKRSTRKIQKNSMA